MKEKEEVIIKEILTEEKKAEILAFINANWEEFYTQSEMARYIENAYIFGPLGENEHFKIDDIMDLIQVVYLEKNPVPEVEEPELEENE
jgi:hypothetical protein